MLKPKDDMQLINSDNELRYVILPKVSACKKVDARIFESMPMEGKINARMINLLFFIYDVI